MPCILVLDVAGFANCRGSPRIRRLGALSTRMRQYQWIGHVGSKKRSGIDMMRMNSIITLAGAALIFFGIVTFAYRGIPYRSGEKVIEVASVRTSVNSRKVVPMSSLLIGLMLMGGAVLVGVGSTKSP